MLIGRILLLLDETEVADRGQEARAKGLHIVADGLDAERLDALGEIVDLALEEFGLAGGDGKTLGETLDGGLGEDEFLAQRGTRITGLLRHGGGHRQPEKGGRCRSGDLA